MLLTLLKVEGHSMEPVLKNGSFFVASSFPYFLSSPRINDIVIFNFNKKLVVKRLVKINEGKYYLDGDNKFDSLPVMSLDRKQILGKLIFKLR